MPNTVDIPDVGQVEFPDSMSDADITAAIQTKILPQQRAAQVQEAASPRKAALMAEQQALEAQPDPSVGQLFMEEASQPFVQLPKPTVEADDSKLTQFGKGVARSAIGVAEAVESPLGVSLAAVSMLPGVGPILGKLAAGGFGLKSVAGGFEQAAQAYNEGDAAQGGEAVGNIVLGSAMVRGVMPRGARAEAVPVDALQASTVPLVAPAQAGPRWTKATSADTSNIGAELYAGIPNPVTVAKSVVKLTKEAAPYLKAAGEKAVEVARDIGEVAKDIGGEAKGMPQATDYRKSVLNWSARQQQSFAEASDAQRTIREIAPTKVEREAITNWREAAGDLDVLKARAAATTDPTLKAGYEKALSLNPEQITLAKELGDTYAALGERGQTYDVLDNFRDNYVTHIWDFGKTPLGGARTLKDSFKFSQARSFDTFFDGEQAGLKPKTKDIGELLPIYLHEMNQVIANRQLVQELGKGVASDGRPLLAPRGAVLPDVEGSQGGATLVLPKLAKEGTRDYKTLDSQPALSKWRWAAEGENGPVMMKGDVAIHPEVYPKFKNALGKSAIREWYESTGTPIEGIPKALVKGLDMAQSGGKKLMLGLLSPFHQVQEGTHGVGHKVNPFSSIPKIDLVNDVSQMDAARHGLMLAPDRTSANAFMEGFQTSSLIAKLPVLGKLAEGYQDYLFHRYIPGLKYKTYLAALERNKARYEKEIASGEVRPEDVKVLTAEQMNAAYGHLNYADLGRNPTIQHLARLALIAPDFLEARARFTAQGAKGAAGAKVGREQLNALATLAIGQATGAWTIAQLTGGEWDPKHPFEVIHGNRKYTLRSVPEDLAGFVTETGQFMQSRLNPYTVTPAKELLWGTNWKGEKVTPAEVATELAANTVPLSIRGFTGTSESTLSGLEQLMSALGIRVSRYDPAKELRNGLADFKKGSGDAKLVAEAEREEKETFGSSDYSDIRHALSDGNIDKARQEYAELLKVKTPKQVAKALDPSRPFSGSKEVDRQFEESLTDRQRHLWDKMHSERETVSQRFRELVEGQ